MNITNLELIQSIIEFFCAILCVSSAVGISIHDRKNKSPRMLMCMLAFGSCALVFDSWAYIFRGNVTTFSISMTRISNYGAFICGTLISWIYMYYLYNLVSRSTKEGVGFIYALIANICVGFELVILFINVFNDWMFYFDKNNYYHRNNGWYIFTALHLLLLITAIVFIVRYRKSLTKSTIISMSIYTTIPAISLICSIFIKGISFTYIGVAACLIIGEIFYLSEREKINQENGVASYREKNLLATIVVFSALTTCICVSMVNCVLSVQKIARESDREKTQLISSMLYTEIDNTFLPPISVSEVMATDYNIKKYVNEINENPDVINKELVKSLNTICNGMGYQTAFVVCDESKMYYTGEGINKKINPDTDEHDVWYSIFKESGKHYDLDVDTDQVNNDKLTVFINTEIEIDGKFAGVCGVGVDMSRVVDRIKEYEANYDVAINLITMDGTIQVNSDLTKIEKDNLYIEYLENMDIKNTLYENLGDSSRVIMYMPNMDWYLVIEDLNPQKIDVKNVILPSLISFAAGMLVLSFLFWGLSIRGRRMAERLANEKKISETDPLTGLLNRRRYEAEIASLNENDDTENKVFIVLDVNGLKTINDTIGHDAGDKLIIGAAECIRKTFSKYGNVYRTGGDEFVAILECSNNECSLALEEFGKTTAQWKDNDVTELSVSIGVASKESYPELTAIELVRKADKLMYEDKNAYYRRTGKDRRMTW